MSKRAQREQALDRMSTDTTGFNNKFMQILAIVINLDPTLQAQQTKVQLAIKQDAQNIIKKLMESELIDQEFVTMVAAREEQFFLKDSKPVQDSWMETINHLRRLWKDSMSPATKVIIWDFLQEMTRLYLDYLDAYEKYEASIQP